ncbi:T. brucei spp.-specific protein [Trypanosoma brucei gambiense DAL972]|uniref:T. brucei spp.-specific protein n=1 Tax=Trypanosoma brucei gambiense (strain MHOM/CI/86/DAL972) TaxID=679716 RepID=C9ZKT9_TRYB9|nr:T. brucei spp.-specific protein [Trypanosoma brucei gambiense DAL972]CBH09682.1 T. brucei spp.-specific protein [Trypanosoma brucei gambiense DAL972]|eukprot:XP_011771975.1 T. brucei spp.-specific protein [Trypanosoma brucei gambiense DAL972]
MLRFEVLFLLFSLSLLFFPSDVSATEDYILVKDVPQCKRLEAFIALSSGAGRSDFEKYAKDHCVMEKRGGTVRVKKGNCTVCFHSLLCPWKHTCVSVDFLRFFGAAVNKPELNDARERNDLNPGNPAGPVRRNYDAQENGTTADDSTPSPPGEKKRIDSPAGKREDSTENKPNQKVSQSDGNSAPAKQVAGSNKEVNTPTESEGPSRPAEQQGSISEQPLRSIYNTIYSVLLFSL